MTDMSKMREMARDLVRESIMEDAMAQFLAQTLAFVHDDRIKPLQARIEALEREAVLDAKLLADTQALLDAALEAVIDAKLVAEAQIAALTARVEGLTGALRKAEQDFYEAANRFQDEDYEGPHEKFTVNVVCHIKPYFDMNMKHLRDSAAAARAALSTTEEGK